MNISKIRIVALDEILRGVKSKHVWFFSSALAFICILAMHYSTSLAFLFSDSGKIPFTYISFMIILIIGPFFILVTAFDSISNEVEKGTVRYIISKIDRASFMLGKFCSLFLIFAVLTFIVAIMGQVYTYSSGNAFDLERMILFWLFSSLYLGCFISIFIFVSTLSKNNKIAFTMSAILLGITIYFFMQGGNEYLRYLTPPYYAFAVSGTMKNTTGEIDYFNMIRNLVSMLLFIVATLSIDILTFKRRDL
ncbi:ABC transporter permease [Methanolobus profundi]|uniref:ABC-2 type transport system permease protein n=1 Tax=Methanolobus profundi TaxID=487685 RepID=A0A1I4RE70_9EURY|nr:ABC-2 type transport system permease protein [Methanolobus profundi]